MYLHKLGNLRFFLCMPSPKKKSFCQPEKEIFLSARAQACQRVGARSRKWVRRAYTRIQAYTGIHTYTGPASCGLHGMGNPRHSVGQEFLGQRVRLHLSVKKGWCGEPQSQSWWFSFACRLQLRAINLQEQRYNRLQHRAVNLHELAILKAVP